MVDNNTAQAGVPGLLQGISVHFESIAAKGLRLQLGRKPHHERAFLGIAKGCSDLVSPARNGADIRYALECRLVFALAAYRIADANQLACEREFSGYLFVDPHFAILYGACGSNPGSNPVLARRQSRQIP